MITQWLRTNVRTVALSDLSIAKHTYATMHPKPLAHVCYDCQQAAEKALKGYLLYKEQDPPWIHNLEALCELCMEQDPSFETLLKDATDLNPYGSAARYPTELVIDERIAQTVIARAQRVYDFAASKVPDLRVDAPSPTASSK
jgi:HEPN domain-containing protein